jgi:hypothetical protein
MKKPKHHLPATLVAAMFNEAGVTLRPGRAKAIAGALEPALARFKPIGARLPFEAEPGWFPSQAGKAEKRK